MLTTVYRSTGVQDTYRDIYTSLEFPSPGILKVAVAGESNICHTVVVYAPGEWRQVEQVEG